MKIKFICCLIFLYGVSFAQEGSYTIKCLRSDSKDTSINSVDIKNEQVLIRTFNKMSLLPIDILLSANENKLTIIANEQSKTAVSFVLSDYLAALNQQFVEANTRYKLEKIEKPNSEFNYRYKSKDLSIEAVLSKEASNTLQMMKLLKLNPLLFMLQLPTEYQSVKELVILNKGIESKIWIVFVEQKMEDSVFETPVSATKISLDKSKISQNEYDNFIKNLNRSF